MVDTPAVLIVGGGIGGLTLAAALHRQGFPVELVEREPAWEVVGAGLAVQPNGMRVLRALGLDGRVEAAGALIHRWRFCDGRGEKLCETDLDQLWGGIGPFVGIERRALHEALLAGAAGVPMRLGLSVLALATDGDRVAVRFTDGSVGAYDLVVGADGISSAVRRLAFGPAPVVYAGQMVWRSVAPIRPRGLAELQLWLGEGAFFGLCPTGGGATYGFANATMPRFRDPEAGRLARLRERFSSFGGAVAEYLAALTGDAQIHCSAIEWVTEPAWRAGHVVLIGDAAHATPPLMGQGGCMAMEDALVLAEALHAERDVGAALSAFVARREARTTWVREQSERVATAFALPAPARDGVLRDRGDAMLCARYAPLVAPL